MEKRPDILIRRARAEDEPYIREFTKNTFEWGDYVGDAFKEWLDGRHDVFVAESAGVPVAVTCVSYPADGEAWFQGIRVHPDFRKMGIGGRLTETSIAAAKERGAYICRANIDSDNFRSQRMSESAGFRQVARILEYVVDVRESSAPPAVAAEEGADPTEGPVAAASDSISVAEVSPDEAASLLDLASKQIKYLGSDYVWVSLNAANLRRVAGESTLLVAKDKTGAVAGGAVFGEMYEADREQGREDDDPPRLDGSMGSFFGSPEGIRALIGHAESLIRGAARSKGILPGRLFLSTESDCPALPEIRRYSGKAASELHVPDDIGLWELKPET